MISRSSPLHFLFFSWLLVSDGTSQPAVPARWWAMGAGTRLSRFGNGSTRGEILQRSVEETHLTHVSPAALNTTRSRSLYRLALSTD